MEPLDQIHIRDLAVSTIIGVHPHERTQPQEVILNLTLFVDTRVAGQTDDLRDAVNYQVVHDRVYAYVASSQHFLIEALAARVAQIVLQEFPIRRVRVSVEKPGALIHAGSVGVTIEREV